MVRANKRQGHVIVFAMRLITPRLFAERFTTVLC
nr:MAG TPA: hypothetical protein [Bacteriophage sp.]